MIQNVADIYIRLSDQDRNKKNENDESESIQNQRKMLVDYCRKRKWQINGIYCDEDYSEEELEEADEPEMDETDPFYFSEGMHL